ncbi:exodeoxyribonuclease VII small subunit [Vagococcus acidifermentans]|uniref:Exodeoxyribonuclease 7 small subunit n=1 Tax=Vagococcus acidifermentans TaxID=564710 RepID=A0A430AWP0_9ENTE|nr:exodeoxyribonuclease VII small subunit [Vagococcus acidifermentans]RSU12463.1 exodeoxyribonuclease VII small subunit [Vagococcus acidifermentans]
MTTENRKTFEEAMTELEGIVKELEGGDIPLEQALAHFQKGVELSKLCQETLTSAEEMLTKIMTENGQEIPFDDKGEE